MLQSMFRQGIPCGSIQGVPLRVHFLLPVLMIILTVYCLTSISDDWGVLGFCLLLWGPITFGTLYIRLLGRALAMRYLNYEHLPEQFVLWPLGYVILGGRAPGPKEDLLSLLAGAFTHVPQAALWLLFAWLSQRTNRLEGLHFQSFHDPDTYVHSLCWIAVLLNAWICALNIFIPAHPLEGGVLLADAMLVCKFSIRTTAWTAVWLSVIGGAGFIAVGSLPWLHMYGFIMIGLLVLWSTYVLWRCIVDGQIEHHWMFTSVSMGACAEMRGCDGASIEEAGTAKIGQKSDDSNSIESEEGPSSTEKTTSAYGDHGYVDESIVIDFEYTGRS